MFCKQEICSQAYPYFEKAAAIREEAERKLVKDRKRARFLAVLAGILAAMLLSVPMMIIPLLGLTSLLSTAGGVAVGMKLYRTVLTAPAISVRR